MLFLPYLTRHLKIQVGSHNVDEAVGGATQDHNEDQVQALTSCKQVCVGAEPLRYYYLFIISFMDTFLTYFSIFFKGAQRS